MKFPIFDSMQSKIQALVLEGRRLSKEHGQFLYETSDIHWLGSLADEVRKRKKPGDSVTYVIDRNINYTNVCTTLCKFCAFYRKPGAEGAYLLSNEDIGTKIDEAKELGATSILLQGGHNPKLRIEYYEELFAFIGQKHPIHLHALSPPEILHIAQISNLNLKETLRRLRVAGLASIPGGGAEILSDRVRQEISPHKARVERWLDVMESAHEQGIPSSATMMFGHVESREERLDHLLLVRELQDKTSGFTAFIPWTFQPANTELNKDEYHMYNNGAVEYLKTVAVSRLMLDNIDNIQASWVTQGAKIAQIALCFGANDFGSTMIEENVVKAAGVSYSMGEKDIVRFISEAGYKPRRRTILYEDLGQPFYQLSSS